MFTAGWHKYKIFKYDLIYYFKQLFICVFVFDLFTIIILGLYNKFVYFVNFSLFLLIFQLALCICVFIIKLIAFFTFPKLNINIYAIKGKRNNKYIDNLSLFFSCILLIITFSCIGSILPNYNTIDNNLKGLQNYKKINSYSFVSLGPGCISTSNNGQCDASKLDKRVISFINSQYNKNNDMLISAIGDGSLSFDKKDFQLETPPISNDLVVNKEFLKKQNILDVNNLPIKLKENVPNTAYLIIPNSLYTNKNKYLYNAKKFFNDSENYHIKIKLVKSQDNQKIANYNYGGNLNLNPNK
jgi:hypothetical protein